MADSRTLDVSLRLDRLDDLFVTPETQPWSRHYAEHSAQPALEYITEELRSHPSYRQVSAVFEVPPDQVDQPAADEVQAAIDRWSAARIAQHDRAAGATARRGMRFLVAGMIFFAVALGLSKLTGDLSGDLADTLSRGFEVFAWVVLWFPLDVLVFGMWQRRLDRRAAEAMGQMSVELVTRVGP